MKIVVSNNYDGPIYEQIKSQILQAILSRELMPGDILPSLRSLARDLKVGCSRLTALIPSWKVRAT